METISVLAGVGNVYLAEVLYRARHGLLTVPGPATCPSRKAAVWTDLLALMRAGVRTGLFTTLRPSTDTAVQAAAADRNGR